MRDDSSTVEPTGDASDSFGSFLRDEFARVGVRLYVLLHGVTSAAFWALFFVLWTMAAGAGYAVIGWFALALYLTFAAPLITLQLLLIADLLGYVVLGQIFIWPKLLELAKQWEKATPEPRPLTVRDHVALFLGDASPLAPLALWSMLVLSKMPNHVHAKLRFRELTAQEIRLDRAVYASAVDRISVA